MNSVRSGMLVLLMLVLGLAASGCATGGAEVAAPASVAQTTRQLPSLATSTPMPAPLPLVVLHTNDNWGETEPCG